MASLAKASSSGVRAGFSVPLLILLLSVAGACSEDEGATAPGFGSLHVSASTAGEFLEPPEFTLRIESAQARTLPGDGSVTITGLAAGTRELELTGLSDLCEVQGSNPRSVTIRASETAETTFVVHCSDFIQG